MNDVTYTSVASVSLVIPICLFHRFFLSRSTSFSQLQEGAKDALSASELTAFLQTAASLCPEGDMLIDDRPKLTVGRKLLDLRRMGIPLVVVPKVRFRFVFLSFHDDYHNGYSILLHLSTYTVHLTVYHK